MTNRKSSLFHHPPIVCIIKVTVMWCDCCFTLASDINEGCVIVDKLNNKDFGRI